ncbi:MATE family efflux transporter [Vibrio campbellii]|uniref:MATE family efflux transporter n=2 Tax=Vibrio campbellii TaxID=680 RepID=UPI000576F67D|nr:MATE family efflux transporter [Vibrio campbellii]ARV72996.1 hypothetical protein A8140_09840 [Vibrio campbellii CAIM 519 = NBRC 15631 = ATCC 25920]
MKDFTQGSLHKHILIMAIPIAINMIFQTLTNLVDVYFVGKLGGSALAGVATSGNISFINMLITQTLFTGLVTIVSHAVGRKDFEDANKIYSHGIFYGLIFSIIVLIAGELFIDSYLSSVVDDRETYLRAKDYLTWFIPFLSLQVIYTSLVAPMYAIGLAKPFLYINIISQLFNVCLTPIFINGIKNYIPGMGVSGASLASFLSGVSALLLALYYSTFRLKSLKIDLKLIRSNWDVFRRIFKVGFPSGITFLIYFITTGAIYWALNLIGALQQAGFGLGSKIGESILLPAMAIAFACPSIAGQNYAAGKHDRVKKTFVITLMMSTILLSISSIICFIFPSWLPKYFSNDLSVISASSSYLQYVGLSFPILGLIFTMNGMFQALGNTIPTLISAAIRMVVLIGLIYYFSNQPYFNENIIWLLLVLCSLLQSVISYVLLRKAFTKKIK